LVEHVITQPKVRDLFKVNTYKVDYLVDKLLNLILKSPKEIDSNEIYTRLISHLAFCGNLMSDDT